jgi:tetratricopeptide (TPR) repeat protein
LGIDRSKVLHSAQLFASKGQFDAAIGEWKKLSAESPGDGGIHNSIGELHLKRNATADAVASFIQAANAFRAEGATLKAIATYKKVLKLDPSRYDMYRFLGDLNAERGLLSSAVQDYLTLGKHYLKERKTKEALDIYKKIVSQDPSNLDAQQRVAELCLQENMQDEATKVYLQLGRERSGQQRYAEAKEAYESVLRIDPGNSEAHQYIEHYKKTDGTPVRPAKTVAAAPQTGEPTDLLAEASRRIEEKQYAGAEAILNQMLTKEPGNPRVCQLLARLHLQQGQLQVALGEYRFLAGAALRAQDYPQAEALIGEFLAVEPHSVPLLELHGELYEEKGEIETAVKHYGQAIEVLLKNPEPGMPTLHEEIFEKVQSLAPESPVVQRLAVLMRGEAPAEAPVEAPSSPAPAPTIGGFSIEGAAPDDAWNTTMAMPGQDRHLQDRHLHAPDESGAVAASETTDEFSIENAAPDGERGVTAEPPAPAMEAPGLSVAERFRAYVEAGQWAQAEQWLGTVVKSKPEDPECREFLGRVLEHKGDGAGAALQYGRALELRTAGQAISDGEPIRYLFDKVKELAPASPIVSKLSVLFVPVAPQAPADDIDSDTHYTLGVAYKNMGLVDEAKEEFALAMKGADVFLDACLMTAVCLKEQEQYDLASAQLERLLTDQRCHGAKAQAIRYELGLLYEKQEQWQLATTMFEAIPTFHDVPQRLAAIRTAPKPAAAKAFRYAT